MKHIQQISRRAPRAEGPTTGVIISIIAQILAVIGQALVAKEAGEGFEF